MEIEITLVQALAELERVKRELREVKAQYAVGAVETENAVTTLDSGDSAPGGHTIIEYPTEHPYIYTNPAVHGGEPTIRGSGITVRTIVESTRVGYSVEELLKAYPLTPAKIHDALSYYYDHSDEIEKLIKENEEALWRLTNRASTLPSTQTKT